MTVSRASADRAALRAPEPSEADAAQAVWAASFRADEPAGWSQAGWSVAAWSTQTRVLVVDGKLVGVVAIRGERAPDGAMPGRIALDVEARRPPLGAMLVSAAIDLIREAGADLARIFVPSRAAWLQVAVREAGFERVRTIAHMLMPADAPTPPLVRSEGWTMRPIAEGEDERVLAALNRAWAGTWNFVSITPEMLQADLVGQREGMLLGVLSESPERIIATCHAVFEPKDHNPDGAPRAWISNLTVDPEFRGQGIARAMLAAGIAHLRSRGATSITLGVDADDPAPFTLYRSVGFEMASSLEAWDAPLRAT